MTVRIGEALRADRPDLVLNSGDISLDGASTESDLAAARALHDGLDLPVRSRQSPGAGGRRADSQHRRLPGRVRAALSLLSPWGEIRREALVKTAFSVAMAPEN